MLLLKWGKLSNTPHTYVVSKYLRCHLSQESTAEASGSDEEDAFPGDGWIGPDNYEKCFAKFFERERQGTAVQTSINDDDEQQLEDKRQDVACMTSDFSMQVSDG